MLSWNRGNELEQPCEVSPCYFLMTWNPPDGLMVTTPGFQECGRGFKSPHDPHLAGSPCGYINVRHREVLSMVPPHGEGNFFTSRFFFSSRYDLRC